MTNQTVGRLSVLRGIHAGAQVALTLKGLTVGADSARCEIVLSDVGIASCHAVLKAIVGGGWLLQPAGDAAITVAGLPVGVKGVVLRPPALFWLTPGKRDASTEPFGQAAGEGVELLLEGNVVAPASSPAIEAPKSRPVTQRAAVAALLSALVLVATLSRWNSSDASLAQVADKQDAQRLGAVLEGLGLVDARVRSAPTGELTLHGRAASNQQVQRIEQQLRERKLGHVRLHLRVDSLTGHLDPTLTKSPSGDFEQRSDGVALLEHSTRSGEPGAARRPEVLTLSIRSVSLTSTPYLETVDGERYLLGSAMPGGYRLVEISPDAIILEREGDRRSFKLPKPPADRVMNTD